VPSPSPEITPEAPKMDPQPSPAPTVKAVTALGITPVKYDSVEVEPSEPGKTMEETMSFETQKVEFEGEGEYDEVTEVTEPEPVARISGEMESVQKGCVIMAILSQFKDIWVSRVDENTVSVEYMDGPIARFHIEGGKVKFQDGSFNDVEPATKTAIKEKFNKLINAMK
jgi:hypothetical protein